ncbi:MAG: hypothetical protein C4539_16315 [Ignavibacteriales bacterium]|nr:MAG: hypothetical protein C4539_16315 [Ignavibacteriales bacterium]
MKKIKIGLQLIIITIGFFFLCLSNSNAQDIRWLRISELQTPINEVGAEYEGEFTQGNSNYCSWPAQYGTDQNTMRFRGLLIGCKNFNDPVENKIKSYKVIGSGPKAVPPTDQIFPVELKLKGQFNHPNVVVDDANATVLNSYDILDETDQNLMAEREVHVKYNTSMGITVTKKVMSFSGPDYGSFIINDYVFKNTGIVDDAGTVKQQTLQDVYFYFMFRYAFAGVTSSGYGSTWGAFSSCWGNSNIYHQFGEDITNAAYTDPNSEVYKMRGFYSWYGPNADRTVSYDEDWGCPNEAEDGLLGSAKYGGAITLHADKSPQDQSDDERQPNTTWFISPDISMFTNTNPSQYDEIFMSERYKAMSEGHTDKPHDQYVGNDYPINYTDPVRQTGGGTSQGQGFGPYTLAYGDSIHIVFAEAFSGISWEKCREVGANWVQWYKQTAKPTLTMPDGSTTTDYNLYKRRWCETGKDSILKTLKIAKQMYTSGYSLQKAPPPPGTFTVSSGGDRIQLSWADNATSAPNFDGYVIYRSRGNVLDYRTEYEKIFECDKSNLVHSFDDVTALRGFDYYYYIQSKDDGTVNQVEPGKPLYSSLFWTVTSAPANLQRPAVLSTLDSIRVVPNPYDIRARLFQFGDQSQYDRLAFYGLPPVCQLKIFTERGDLIWEKNHTRGTGDELWDSKTSSGQIVTSGIYILYVETPDGRSVYRKFVIIR